jgi:peptide/nickel transport system substrate-binding protein
MRLTRGLRALIALLVCAALFAAACGGDDGGGDSAPPETDGSTENGSTTSTTVAPVAGGTVTFGSFVPLGGFDPIGAVRGVYGCCGGVELSAIYDVLLEYDSETGEYSGRTAESFTPNADFTEWTLKLRPGIKFTDGTDYNAEAVALNVERHRGPASLSASKPLVARFIESVTAVDETTAVFTLKEAWSGLPTLLTKEVGMIASPAAIAKAGDAFNGAPGDSGAGPFKLASFKPGESIELVKNPDYWGGEVYLDGLKFVQLGSEANTYESLKAGTIQAMYTRNAQVVADIKEDDAPHVTMSFNPMGVGFVFNSGITVTCQGGQPEIHCEGQADGASVSTDPSTAELKVRQAFVAAIDPEVINTRAFDGTATITRELFPEPIPWAPGIEQPGYDVDRAKELVEEAKAEGWDGKLALRVPNTNAEVGIAAETMLEIAGFDVDLNSNEDTNALVSAVLGRRDFEATVWSLGMSDEIANNYAQFSLSFQGDQPRYGYSSPELDEALERLRVAGDAATQEAAMSDVTQILADDLPFISFSVGEETLAYAENLQGLQYIGGARVDFSKAFLAD